jgi:hypothetical protein
LDVSQFPLLSRSDEQQQTKEYYGWGNNKHGQLGLYEYNLKLSPTRMPLMLATEKEDPNAEKIVPTIEKFGQNFESELAASTPKIESNNNNAQNATEDDYYTLNDVFDDVFREMEEANNIPAGTMKIAASKLVFERLHLTADQIQIRIQDDPHLPNNNANDDVNTNTNDNDGDIQHGVSGNSNNIPDDKYLNNNGANDDNNNGEIQNDNNNTENENENENNDDNSDYSGDAEVDSLTLSFQQMFLTKKKVPLQPFSIHCGRNYTYILTKRNGIFSFGENNFSQLGSSVIVLYPEDYDDEPEKSTTNNLNNNNNSNGDKTSKKKATVTHADDAHRTCYIQKVTLPAPVVVSEKNATGELYELSVD